MSCGSCSCCPKCGCKASCNCNRRIEDAAFLSTAGDFSSNMNQVPVGVNTCDKCAQTGVCDCGKKREDTCDKCAQSGVCDCGKKRTVGEDTCDKCAQTGVCDCGKK